MIRRLYKGFLIIVALIVMTMVAVVEAGVRAALHLVPRAPSEVFVGIEKVGTRGSPGLTISDLPLSIDDFTFVLSNTGAPPLANANLNTNSTANGADICRSGPILAPC